MWNSFSVPKVFHILSLHASTLPCGNCLHSRVHESSRDTTPIPSTTCCDKFSPVVLPEEQKHLPAFYGIQTSLPHILWVSENGKRVEEYILKLRNSCSTAGPSNLLSSSIQACHTVKPSPGFYSASSLGFPTLLLCLLSLIFILTLGSQKALQSQSQCP